jgi:selenocysteine lyase/cysteine desulfurase
VLSDDAIQRLRVEEFAVTGRFAYLDYATFGPLPSCHVRAAFEALEQLRDGLGEQEGVRALDATRDQAAMLLGCDSTRIALLKSTSEGLGLVAEGLDWREADEVVVYEREFVGCLAPFLRLRSQGVVVRTVTDRGRSRFELDDVVEAVTPRTRAVCVSVVNRSHGMRAPVEALGALCRERGIWLALDAAQAMGVTDLDVERIGADIVAAHGYKFLCSGFGLAVTYCSERATAELRVPQVGWSNAELEGPSSDASRFESTMCSIPLLAGMRESLRLLNGVEGTERERRAVAAIDMIAAGLVERGYQLVSSRLPEERSALLVARHPTVTGDEIVSRLRAGGVICTPVDGAFRISAHFTTTRADVDRFFDVLPHA